MKLRLSPAMFRALFGRRLTAIVARPPAKLFADLAYRARGWSGVPYRAAYYLAGSWKRLRAPSPAHRIRLSGNVAADLRRAVALVQASGSESKADLRLVAGTNKAVPLLSVLLMSEAFGNIEILFDEPTDDVEHASAGTGARFGEPSGRLFSHPAFEHNVNRYLKVAHPGAFVVAVSLPEEPDGFCDRHFELWKDALGDLARDSADIAVVLLNPIGRELCRSGFVGRHGPIFSARLAGLSLGETVCLAQSADAFIGQVDLYGLAARAAQRPGVYMDAGQSPQQAVKLFREVMASRKDARPGRREP